MQWESPTGGTDCWKDSLQPSKQRVGPDLRANSASCQCAVWLVPPCSLSCAVGFPCSALGYFLLPSALHQGEEANVGTSLCFWQQPAGPRAGSAPHGTCPRAYLSFRIAGLISAVSIQEGVPRSLN